MRRNSLYWLLAWCWPIRIGAVPDVSFEVFTFQVQGGGFAEIALYVSGSSLKCGEAVTGEHGVTYSLIIENSAGELAAGDRIRLEGAGCPARDIVDLRRFRLGPGDYTITMEAADIQDTAAVVRLEKAIRIPEANADWKLSELQLLSVAKPDTGGTSNLHKSGLYMEPLPFQYYYPALRRLYAYLETYHLDQCRDQPFIRYSISPATGDLPAPTISYKKVDKVPVQAHLLQLDIADLISGTYRFEVALYDGKDNEIASQQYIFYRYNPKGDSLFLETAGLRLEDSFVQLLPDDSLNYYLKAHIPVAGSMDGEVINQLVQKGSPKAKRFFIHRYWTSSSGRLASPAFAQYMRVARYIDELFRSGFGYGFETDRGHIFMKYGRPDDIITVEDEPSAPPYEIWFYNHFPATRQQNVRFLFYNPTLAKNGHRLLHATAIGEVNNPRWELELYRDATMETPGVNDRVMGDNFHRNARRYFENH